MIVGQKSMMIMFSFETCHKLLDCTTNRIGSYTTSQLLINWLCCKKTLLPVSQLEIKFGIEQFKFFKLNSNCLTVSVCHQTWLQTIFQTNLISNWCELWDCEQFDIKFMRVMELQTSANFANYCELCELFQTLSLRIVWFQILSNCSLAN